MSELETISARNVEARFKLLVEGLKEDASWDDVLCGINVCQSIEAGVRDCEEGRTITTEEVRRRLKRPAA